MEQNRLNEKALNILQNDILRYADVYTLIKDGICDAVYADEDGVIAKNPAINYYSVALKEKSASPGLIDKYCVDGSFYTVHTDFAAEYIKNRFNREYRNPCFQVVYLKKEITESEHGFEIKVLDMSFREILEANYHSSNPDYIKNRISAGVMFGAFSNGEFCGFIGVHEMPSMGILFVFEKFRRLGVAVALEKFLIKRTLALGRIPYAHVVFNNAPSLNLQKKLGFEVSDEMVYWIR